MNALVLDTRQQGEVEEKSKMKANHSKELSVLVSEMVNYNIHTAAVFNGHGNTQTLFMLGFPASWPSSSSSSRSLSLSLPLADALLAERGLSCSESDPEPEPESGRQMGKLLEIHHCVLQYTAKTTFKK